MKAASGLNNGYFDESYFEYYFRYKCSLVTGKRFFGFFETDNMDEV